MPSFYLVLKSSSTLLSRSQDSLTLSSFYLDLKLVYLYRVFIVSELFQMYIYVKSDFVNNPQRLLLSSQYTLANINGLLMSDLRHLVITF